MYSADSNILGFIFSLGIHATITMNINKSRKQVTNKTIYFRKLTIFDFMTLSYLTEQTLRTQLEYAAFNLHFTLTHINLSLRINSIIN